MASFEKMFANVVTVGARAYALTENRQTGLLTLYRTYAARVKDPDATVERHLAECKRSENGQSDGLSAIGTWKLLFQCDLFRDPEVSDRLTVLVVAAACGDETARELALASR